MDGYFDNAATTAVDPGVRDAMLPALGGMYGNPSSLHGMGFAAERAVEEARENVAALLGCDKSCVVFTSGGTEANNTALFGAAEANKRRGNRVVTTLLEHSSVLDSAKELARRGYEAEFIRPENGRVTAEQLANAVDDRTILLSCMYANNETGLLLPVFEAAERVKREHPNTLVHADCVQAFGKLPLNLKKSAVDLASVTAHKLHGPKGVGALYMRQGARVAPLLYGGEQQGRRRPGTECVPLIVGFGEACRLARVRMDETRTHVEALNAGLRAGLADLPGAVVHSPADALPWVVSFSMPGVRSEILLHALEEQALYVSSGSACAKGKPSHVLEALGLPRSLADSAVRVSFSRHNEPEDVDRLLSAFAEARERFVR